MLVEYSVTKGKNILNMDESGVRVGCPLGEDVIVPIDIKELYTASPENRKSVTIIETIMASGKEPLPLFIITPGKHIIENWLSTKLIGKESIDCSPIGYTNNRIVMQYLNHLIKYARAGPNKPWKVLLLDSHESHQFDDFQIKANNNHIKLWYFPSHLTHALQPLDVGIFRPWKHFHSLAIQRALRSLDFEYTITSFFRDLTGIRRDTMKYHTIINAFKESGMWPLSAKAGIKKIRSYSKRKRLIEDVDGEADEEQLDLPALLPTRPVEIWMTAANIRALADRDPTMFSDPSIQLFKTTLQSVDLQLQKAHLITIEHAALQEKIRLEKRRKTTSRRSIYKGGGAEEVEVLWARKKARREKEQQIELRRAKRKLSVAVNKAISTLKSRGIQARKDEKARKERLISFEATGELAPVEDLFPVRQPDKDPTPDEAFFCTEKGYPELLLAI